jgi:hypothetical protein
MRRQALVFAGMVEDAVQRGLHPRHGIDHPRHRRDVEGVHDRGRGQRELDRAIHRHGQFVDRGDALFGIDEQPFPIHRDDLDLQRLFILDGLLGADAVQRAIGIQQMRADPGQRAQADDDQQGDGPDHQFQLGRMVPVGVIAGLLVRRAIAPGKPHRQRHDRDDDDQHQQRGLHQQVRLPRRDVARRPQHDRLAARKQHDGRKPEKMFERVFHVVMTPLAARLTQLFRRRRLEIDVQIDAMTHVKHKTICRVLIPLRLYHVCQ